MTRFAAERSAQKHVDHIMCIGLYARNQLVFVDESATDWHTEAVHGLSWGNVPYTRLFLFMESGEYVFYMSLDYLTTCHARYSMLPAMLLDGILYIDIMEGSYNTESFAAFIGALLNQMKPFPEPNSVIIMDNCCIHKSPDILDMITAR